MQNEGFDQAAAAKRRTNINNATQIIASADKFEELLESANGQIRFELQEQPDVYVFETRNSQHAGLSFEESACVLITFSIADIMHFYLRSL